MKRPLNPYAAAAAEAANQLAIEYLPAVRASANRLKERLPDCVDVNDLISAGTEELLKAARRYDESMNDNFWGFAKLRVRGAMLDFLRSLDPLSRASRTMIKKINELSEKYVNEHDEWPSDEWLAAALKCEVADVQKARLDQVLQSTLSVDDAPALNAAQEDDADLSEELCAALSELSEREQLVMQLYYYEELNFSEIAQILGLSTARISQIHNSTITKLKESLNG